MSSKASGLKTDAPDESATLAPNSDSDFASLLERARPEVEFLGGRPQTFVRNPSLGSHLKSFRIGQLSIALAVLRLSKDLGIGRETLERLLQTIMREDVSEAELCWLYEEQGPLARVVESWQRRLIDRHHIRPTQIPTFRIGLRMEDRIVEAIPKK